MLVYLVWFARDCLQTGRLEEVDAALDALTSNPGEAVLSEGNLSCDYGSCAMQNDDAGEVFTAMIRAIKEGK